MMHVSVGEHAIELPAGASLKGVANDLAVAFMIERAIQPVPREYAAWIERIARKVRKSAEARPWTILRVTPGMERRVRDALRDDGLTVHVPLERYRPRNALRSRERPVMPGYLFAAIHCDADLDIARGNRAVRMMCRDGKPVLVDALEVGAMILREAFRGFDLTLGEPPPRPKRSRRNKPLKNWRRGERVRIASGAFSGRSGEIVKADRADRIELLLDLLGRATPIALDEVFLEGWDAP